MSAARGLAPPTPQTLDDHLDLCAAESNLTLAVHGPASRALQTALAADAVLRDQAQAVVEGTADLEERDYVSRWRNALLRNALSGVVS